MSSPDPSRPKVPATCRTGTPCGDPPADSGPIEALKGASQALEEATRGPNPWPFLLALVVFCATVITVLALLRFK